MSITMSTGKDLGIEEARAVAPRGGTPLPQLGRLMARQQAAQQARQKAAQEQAQRLAEQRRTAGYD